MPYLPIIGVLSQTQEEATKVWVYQGTSGTFSRSVDEEVAICKGYLPSTGLALLEAAYPAQNEDIGRTGRAYYWTDAPQICITYYYEVEAE